MLETIGFVAGLADDTIYGGDGDDYIQGDQDNDLLYGEGGDDTVLGFTGDDTINGGDGLDKLYGQQDNDTLNGGADRDIIRGDVGDDVLNGDSGNDYVRGDAGNDILNGGDGNDAVFGGEGDDILRGDAGVDRLRGENGNDTLRGGADADFLFGGDGIDSLFGGYVGDGDQLRGDAGADRFLTEANDSIADMEAGLDVQIVFEDATSSWSNLEIEVMDRGFAELVERTQNNHLITETLNTDPLRFIKHNSLGASAGINYLSWSTTGNWTPEDGWVYETTYAREIQIADWNELDSFQNDQYADVTIHEIAHNWDSGIELTAVSAALSNSWDQFLTISDWTDVDPGSSNYTLSGDGLWWYADSAGFAENYGRTNPNEDLATIFELYFGSNSTADSGIQSKLDWLDSVMDTLTT